MKRVKTNDDIQCIDFRYDEGVRGRTDSDIAATLTTRSSGYSGLPMLMQRESSGEVKKLRIRKLTPKECMRLMGFTDEDYQALVDSGLSNAAIYHVAGDSIITTCLVSILSPLVNGDTISHKKIVDDYVSHYFIEERN